MSTEMIETIAEAEIDDAPAPAGLADLEPKMRLQGTVKRLELYGAFIDLGLDTMGLIHISKLGGEQVNRVSDVLKEGDTVTVWVEKVDPERQQIMLTMVEPLAVDWNDLKVDEVLTGKVTRLENFGAFVDIGAEREGLVHVSELSHDYVKHPSEVVKVGQEVQVKVINFSRRKRRIDLSMKALQEKPQAAEPAYVREREREREAPVVQYDDEPDDSEVMTAMEIAMRRALGNDAVLSVKAQERGNKKTKKQRAAQRQQQEDLLSRTLQLQQSEN